MILNLERFKDQVTFQSGCYNHPYLKDQCSLFSGSLYMEFWETPFKDIKKHPSVHLCCNMKTNVLLWLCPIGCTLERFNAWEKIKRPREQQSTAWPSGVCGVHFSVVILLGDARQVSSASLCLSCPLIHWYGDGGAALWKEPFQSCTKKKKRPPICEGGIVCGAQGGFVLSVLNLNPCNAVWREEENVLKVCGEASV